MFDTLEPQAGKHISRRDFARRAAIAAATVAVVPAEALGESKKTATPVKPPEKPPEKPAATPSEPAKELSPASQAEVENAYKNILDRYGARLNAEQRKDVHRLLVQQQKGIDAMRAFPLDNADEPATVLHVVQTPRPMTPPAGTPPEKG